MSVLVKGIDMPINCQACAFDSEDGRFCKAAKEYIPMLGKPQFCPLVEVRHGRWVSIGNTVMAKCFCGFFTDRWKTYRYCPNCGSRMDLDGDTE